MVFFQAGIRFFLTTISCIASSFLFVVLPASAQTVISGYVRDASSGEFLSSASIKIEDKKTTTNNFGFFSISTSKSTFVLQISHIGFQQQEHVFTPARKDSVLQISLVPNILLDEIQISNQRNDENLLRSAQMGISHLNVQDLERVPVLMGESDIIKTIQLLPGVMSAGEGSSTLFVRGGMGDQNLILLDGAPVFNASHLFGFFSTFNNDAIRSVDVYKGEMPAQFGGRVSSVLDIHMHEGNNQRFRAEGGLGLIASRLKLEGPIIRDKASFMISARRTYADMFLKFSPDETINKSQLYFYDLNLKANVQLNPKNRLYLSGYLGKDQLGYADLFSFSWGNSVASLRWNAQWSNRLFSNFSGNVSTYNYKVGLLDEDVDLEIASHIKGYQLKQDIQYSTNTRGLIRFGWDAHLHEMRPVNIETGSQSPIHKLDVTNRRGAELAGYISHEFHVTPSFNIIYGLRASNFLTLGPGVFFDYQAGTGKIDRIHGADFDIEASELGIDLRASELPRGMSSASVTSSLGEPYGKWDVVRDYWQIQPRLSLNYSLNSRSSVKAAFARHSQIIHQISQATSSLPTDAWLLSNVNIKPQLAEQYSLGYYRNLGQPVYLLSIEAYYKDLKNQLEYREGADLPADEHLEAELVSGIGRAYGVEALLKKSFGVWSGWIGYTWSKTERKFDDLNQGRWFNARQDRTHDLSTVLIWEVDKRWSVSGTFIYATGHAVTYPSGKYQVDGKTIWYYSARNAHRMPDYHRLDLSVTWEGRKNRAFSSNWVFGVYNAYNRKNAYIIDFREGEVNPNQTDIYRVALFGAIPSVTWNFKF